MKIVDHLFYSECWPVDLIRFFQRNAWTSNNHANKMWTGTSNAINKYFAISCKLLTSSDPLFRNMRIVLDETTLFLEQNLPYFWNKKIHTTSIASFHFVFNFIFSLKNALIYDMATFDAFHQAQTSFF